MIAKLLAGSNLSLTSTGVDSGTGDVTLNVNIGGPGTLTVNGLGDSITGAQSNYGLYSSTDYQNQLTNTIPAWQASHAYTLNQLVKNGSPSRVFVCTTAGTSAGSGGPSGTTTSGIVDNTAQWGYVSGCNAQKTGSSYLFWAETYSQHNLVWDMEAGYGGVANSLLKAIVVSGGTAYSGADTISINNGASATLTVSGGVITACTVTNPGQSGGTAFIGTITTSTGSGAYIFLVQGGSGTFGVPGCTTKDMVAMLPDVVASAAQVIVVHGGTNDNTAQTTAQSIANLTTIYNTLLAAGKRVIAVPILPRSTNMTATRPVSQQRINNFIRGYARRRLAAGGAYAYSQIALADPTLLLTDGTQGTMQPIGGSGGVANAVMKDGLHPSNRGAQYIGYVITQAAARWIGSGQICNSRPVSADDGYDPVFNPGGNILEGMQWLSSTAYATQQQVLNGGNIYRCITAGTSASSGGPTTTSTNITDGSAHWAYMWPAKTSVMASGATGTISAAAGVTITGNVPTGMSMSRGAGSAAGTLTASIENPWANGQIGQRLKLVFSLGSGTTLERWDMVLLPSTAYASHNILSGELGTAKFQAEIEIEIAASANLTRLNLSAPVDGTITAIAGPALSGAGNELVQTSGDPMALPNGGRLLIKGPIVTLPTNITNNAMQLFIGFNASGGAGSATATIYINYLALRRVDQF